MDEMRVKNSEIKALNSLVNKEKDKAKEAEKKCTITVKEKERALK
jgi:hypothetical protein